MTCLRRRAARAADTTFEAVSTGHSATILGMPGVVRLLVALAWPGIRAARVAVILVSAGAGLLLELLMVVGRAGVDGSIRVDLVRVLALVGVAGVAFALEDEAASITAVQPVTYAVRCTARYLLLVPAFITWWAAVLILSGHIAAEPETTLPGWGLSVEGTTFAAVAVLVAAWPRRRSGHRLGGLVAISVVTACAGVLRALSFRWPLLPVPTDPRWLPVHRAWAVTAIAVAGAVAVVVAERPRVTWPGARAETSPHRARRPPTE